MTRQKIALSLLIAAIPLIAVLPLPDFWIAQLNYIGLYALVSMGLVLLTGVGGLTSFGQAAFVGRENGEEKCRRQCHPGELL